MPRDLTPVWMHHPSTCNEVYESSYFWRTAWSVTVFDSCQSQQPQEPMFGILLLIFIKSNSTTPRESTDADCNHSVVFRVPHTLFSIISLVELAMKRHQSGLFLTLGMDAAYWGVMNLPQTAVFLHAADGLCSRQSPTASPHVWANPSTLENSGETENPAGVEVAKKLKMDQISLPCQEDFLKLMWSNNIFFSCLSPSRIPKYFCELCTACGEITLPGQDRRPCLERYMEGDR